MIGHLKNTTISYEQAISVLKQVALKHRYVDTELVPVQHSLGRMVYGIIRSQVDVPPFDNAAMDGYAINSLNLRSHPAENNFVVHSVIKAGDKQLPSLNDIQACKIMTGAPMPSAFDLVVPVEKVEQLSVNGAIDEHHIAFSHPVQSGDNVRLRGTDYQKGQKVCEKYAVIAPQHIMAMAATGHQQVEVLKKVPIAVISTGNELSETDEDDLLDGKIFNANAPFLKAYMGYIHCQTRFSATSIDDESAFLQLVDQAINKKVKIIISTGMVSMGECDFIPKVLKSIGAKIHFHKVRVRPGKPILCAELPNGIIYFGLPGNPIAVASGVRFFIEPFIRMMIGMAPEKKISAKLSKSVDKKKGFMCFYKALIYCDAQGQLICEVLEGQGSFHTQSFSHANAWMVVQEESDHIEANDLVEVVPVIPGQLMRLANQ